MIQLGAYKSKKLPLDNSVKRNTTIVFLCSLTIMFLCSMSLAFAQLLAYGCP